MHLHLETVKQELELGLPKSSFSREWQHRKGGHLGSVMVRAEVSSGQASGSSGHMCLASATSLPDTNTATRAHTHAGHNAPGPRLQSIAPLPKRIRHIAVGDSITNGWCGSSSYPDYFRKWLGWDTVNVSTGQKVSDPRDVCEVFFLRLLQLVA